ncbi:unnamed protein product [Polarella glacialis]|uniref:Uncharacterized protein n=1 Tax=Polarella glacialis TaxID=89957 RepID=A0A813ELB3_POLGL|nr:unnamed protein product [Polarella glacialis]
MSSLGFSPDQASSQAWKNFAQSQSPPSVSPIRRALMGDSASSGEEGEAPSKRLKPDPLARALLAEDEDAEDAEAEEEEAAPEAVAPMDDGEEDDDEEEEEDQQMQHTAGSPNAFSAPGVQVLRSSVGGAAESSAESDAEDVPPVAEATGLAASAPSADASRQTPAATAATQDEEEDEEEAEEEEVVQDEEEAEVSEGLQESPDVDEQADDLPEPNGAALAEDPAAARSEAAQMAAAVGVAHQIVAAESWGGSLPPEARQGPANTKQHRN